MALILDPRFVAEAPDQQQMSMSTEEEHFLSSLKVDAELQARAPAQLRMETPHWALDRQGTKIIETFQEARYWFSCLDSCHQVCCNCFFAKSYSITDKGLKVIQTRPCSQSINNVDWPSIDDVDYHTDCCYGYVELATVDNELGDVSLRVRKGDTERIAQSLLNLSTGRGPHAREEVLRTFKESCICLDPSSFFTEYVVARSSLKIRRRGCLPCTGASVNSIRWVNRHGRGNVLDIDMESDCFFGYVDISTSDKQFGDQTLRVSKGKVDEIVKELRNLNVGRAADAEERKLVKFQEAGPCYGCCDCCVPRCCNPFYTMYVLAERSLHVKRWRPWRASTNFVDWFRVRDVDTERDCCLGYLDLSTSDAKLQNVVLKVAGSKVDALANNIHNLRSGRDYKADEGEFRSFREATWCDCCRCLWDPCPTRYILTQRGLKVKQSSYCTGWSSLFKIRTNYVDWDKVRDVDHEKGCCFGYVDLQTWDKELGDVLLRVRKGTSDKVVDEVFNKSLGHERGAIDPVLHQFREAGIFNCCRCFGTRYLLTQKALKVKETSPLSSKLNNVPWHMVQDVDQEGNCCFGYVDVSTTDRKLGDVILRVWPWETDKVTDALRNLRAGKSELTDRVIKKFYPRGWGGMLTCYQGICWFHHSESYWITESGLKVRHIRLVRPQGGVFKSRVNHIPWRNIRDVDQRSDCCWGFVDIDTADTEDPNMVIKVLPSELDEIIQALRTRGVFSDGHVYHTSGGGSGKHKVHADPHPDPIGKKHPIYAP
eukprot:TRINITY_DN18513_c0_g2_i1.p1 TRINITY_DN18513_c0_g2~~TRINITY_DN18513_c0_g2_i1.p1  ORF type:complete len:767 (-),score=82.86 TRINITY_DN18513_c0_g2_i1:247-2547(-)